MSSEAPKQGAGLARELGAWDGTLITVGSVIGTGIFLVTSDLARAVPHAGIILLVWIAGGLLSLAGALTYAELGAMYPRAGGIYLFLREAYGPLVGFLYGWACSWSSCRAESPPSPSAPRSTSATSFPSRRPTTCWRACRSSAGPGRSPAARSSPRGSFWA